MKTVLKATVAAILLASGLGAASANATTLSQVLVISADGAGGYGPANGTTYDIYSTDSTFTYANGNLGLTISPSSPPLPVTLASGANTFSFSFVNPYQPPAPASTISWALDIGLNGSTSSGLGVYATGNGGTAFSSITNANVVLSSGMPTFATNADPTLSNVSISAFSITQGVNGVTGSFTLQVPEPASIALIATGLLGLGLVRRRRPSASAAA